MVELFVDVDALLELCRQLEEVKSFLMRAEDDVTQSSHQRLGSSRIRNALSDVAEGWRGGRCEILRDLDGLQVRIRMAIDTYLDQEAALSGAARRSVEGKR